MDANSYDLQILDTFQFGLQTSINNAIAEHRCVKLIYNSCVLSLTECGFKVHTDVNSPKWTMASLDIWTAISVLLLTNNYKTGDDNRPKSPLFSWQIRKYVW